MQVPGCYRPQTSRPDFVQASTTAEVLASAVEALETAVDALEQLDLTGSSSGLRPRLTRGAGICATLGFCKNPTKRTPSLSYPGPSTQPHGSTGLIARRFHGARLGRARSNEITTTPLPQFLNCPFLAPNERGVARSPRPLRPHSLIARPLPRTSEESRGCHDPIAGYLVVHRCLDLLSSAPPEGDANPMARRG